MIYLISRDIRFSPNSQARDAAILRAVGDGLAQRELSVTPLCEGEITKKLPRAALVLSMARSRTSLQLLAEMESAGTKILNSPTALLSHGRADIDQYFRQIGAGMRSLRRATEITEIEAMLPYPMWLKRCDATAQKAGDVRFVENREALKEGLNAFRQTGIDDWIVSEHVTGDLIKFYGVEGTDFFHYGYPAVKGGFSKFRLEQHNGAPQGLPFYPEKLKQTADRAAADLGMPIYGGDAVVRSDGTAVVIDFNDWPSFGNCTEAAAEAIITRALSLQDLIHT